MAQPLCHPFCFYCFFLVILVSLDTCLVFFGSGLVLDWFWELRGVLQGPWTSLELPGAPWRFLELQGLPGSSLEIPEPSGDPCSFPVLPGLSGAPLRSLEAI